MKIKNIIVILILVLPPILSMGSSVQAVVVNPDVDLISGNFTTDTISAQDFHYLDIAPTYINFSWGGTNFHNNTFTDPASTNVSEVNVLDESINISINTYAPSSYTVTGNISVYDSNGILNATTSITTRQHNTTHQTCYISFNPLDDISQLSLGAFDVNISLNASNTTMRYVGYDYQTDVFNVTALPSVIINFAGNLSDSGGPYWRPPGQSTQLTGIWSDGYYTNDSRQKEGWIYINCTINDANNVYLDWLNETTWTNGTYSFSNTVGNYWEINTSNNFSTAEGYNYSFNINATGDDGNTITEWNKAGIDGVLTRRYVQLNCTPEDITYTPYYFYESAPYTENNQHDPLHHDQGPDGSDDDTGLMLSTIPSDIVSLRFCSGFTVYWFDESVCAESFTLDNIYFHTWWSRNRSNAIAWQGSVKTREEASVSFQTGNYTTDVYGNRSAIYYENGLESPYSNNYTLHTHLLDVNNEQYTDNDIYELSIGVIAAKPTIISNRSFTSFILLNVPSNATLNAENGGAGRDSDSDSLNDTTELYVTYTNPFLADTDNDGINDYWENYVGSDPNNWTETYNIVKTLNITTHNISTLNVSWNASNIVDSTLLIRKTGSTPTSRTDGTEVYNGSALYYNNSGLTSGTRYYYRAYAWNDTARWSPFSASGDAYTAPLNPTYFHNTSINMTSITLSWTKGIRSVYSVIRYSNHSYPSTPQSNISGYNGTGNSVTISSLDPDTKYYFCLWSLINPFGDAPVEANFTTEPFRPDPPYSAGFTYNETHVNLSWVRGNYSDNDIVVMNTTQYPITPQNGAMVDNNTVNVSAGRYYFTNSSVSTHVFYTVWSWNSTNHSYSATGLNLPWGGINIIAYNESNASERIYYDVTITNQDGSSIYTRSNLYGYHFVDFNDMPTGDDTIFIVSSSFYKQRIYYFDIGVNGLENLSFYLPPTYSTGGEEECTLRTKYDVKGVYNASNNVTINLTYTPEELIEVSTYEVATTSTSTKTDIIAVTNTTIDQTVNLTYELYDLIDVQKYDNVPIQTAYTDSISISYDHTSPADVVVNFTQTPDLITAVYTYNTSDYGSWVLVPQDKYTNTTTNVTVNRSVLSNETTIARVDYYYLHGYTGGWLSIASDNYTSSTTQVIVNKSILTSNTTMVRVQYYYTLSSGSMGYGSWVPVANDNYTLVGSQITISNDSITNDTTLARVYYYYEHCENITVVTPLYLLTVVGQLGDYTSPTIQDAKMRITRYMNVTGQFENISTVITDANGQASVYLIPNTLYKVIITKDNYETEYADYIPSSELFSHTFRMTPIVDTTTTELFSNHITLYVGWSNASTGLYFNYSDSAELTYNVTFEVYDYFNGSLVYSNTSTEMNYWNDSDFTTANHSLPYTYVFIINHTYWNYTVRSGGLIFPEIDGLINLSTLEDYLEVILGESPLVDPDTGNTVTWVYAAIGIIGFIILISVGSYHASAGVIGLGVWFIASYYIISGVSIVLIGAGVLAIALAIITEYGGWDR